MLINFLGSALVLASGAYIGFYYSRKYARRMNNLSEIKKALLMLKSEITYSKSVLPEAFSNISNRIDKPFADIFAEISHSLLSFGGTLSDVWQHVFSNHKSKLYTTDEDFNTLTSFMNTLGHVDSEMQTSQMEMVLEYLSSKIDELAELHRQKSRAYQTLGVLGGLLVIIILI